MNPDGRTLIEIHIADIHFGVVDPAKEYAILEEQFLTKIEMLNIDILSIDGDLFDHKFMANSPVIMYGIKFIDRCADICRRKGATLVLLNGTESHDSGQLKLFYQYLEVPNLDVRIIETAKFEYIKGARILCLPEEYGKGKEYYEALLYNEEYDSVFMHGTIKGSVYGANAENLGSSKYPIFDLKSFSSCKGPIISGHVHTPGCFETYMYYCGSPIRFRFGEEEEKGFIILLHNLDTRMHYVNFEPIKSFRYDTITIDALQMADPALIVEHLNAMQSNGVDNIRVEFSNILPETIKVVKDYYKNRPSIIIRGGDINTPVVNTTNDIMEKYKGMEFLLDPNIDEYTKFVQYINFNKGSEYITVKQLKDTLAGII